MSYYDYVQGKNAANNSWASFLLFVMLLITAFNIGRIWEQARHLPKRETVVTKTETKSDQGMIIRVK